MPLATQNLAASVHRVELNDKVLWLGLTLMFLLTMGCGGGPQTHPHKLSSGRTIKIISVGQMHFQQSGPALVLSYQTDLKLSQTQELRKEVAEVWKDFQKDVEQAKLGSAIVMANEIPTGRLIQQGRSYNFVFTRNPDGTWPQEPPLMGEAAP